MLLLLWLLVRCHANGKCRAVAAGSLAAHNGSGVWVIPTRWQGEEGCALVPLQSRDQSKVLWLQQDLMGLLFLTGQCGHLQGLPR